MGGGGSRVNGGDTYEALGTEELGCGWTSLVNAEVTRAVAADQEMGEQRCSHSQSLHQITEWPGDNRTTVGCGVGQGRRWNETEKPQWTRASNRAWVAVVWEQQERRPSAS